MKILTFSAAGQGSGHMLGGTRICPRRLLGGGTASLSSFQRSLCSLPPLLGHSPCDQGVTPPWNPRCFALHANQQIRSRPRLALLFEEPCPLRLRMAFSAYPLRLSLEIGDGRRATHRSLCQTRILGCLPVSSSALFFFRKFINFIEIINTKCAC